MKYTEKQNNSCQRQSFSERNFSWTSFKKKETDSNYTEVTTSCFSREEFLSDLFDKKGIVK